MLQKVYAYLQILCRGIGQVIFLESALSGAMLLIGILINSISMGVLAVVGCIIGTLTAQLARFPEDSIRRGLYGFNATLVGIAVGGFCRLSLESLLLLIVACAGVTFLTHAIARQSRLPGLTAPFVLVTWLILALVEVCPSLAVSPEAGEGAGVGLDWSRAVSLSFGQIMLQGHSLTTGLVFFAAIAVHSSRMALDGLIACALALLLALLPFAPIDALSGGLMGYNSILAFLAFSAVLPLSSRRYLWATAAAVLALALQWGGLMLGLTTLTAPFVLAVWLLLLFRSAR